MAAELDGPRIEPRGEQRRLGCDERRLLPFVAGVERRALRVHAEARMGVGAELLEDVHVDADPRQMRPREGAVLEAFYPGRGSVSAAGLRRVRTSSLPGGALVTATARGGDWRLHVSPRRGPDATHR